MLALAVIVCAVAGARALAAEGLTVARLFEAPDLAGDSLRSARLTPDDRRVTYLKGAADDKDRLDLWAYDIGRHTHARLVDALTLQPDGERVSAEEAARRERQRTAAFKGIVDYAVSPDGRQVLIPLNGDLYLQSLATTTAPVRLTSTPAAETDPRFSPRGTFVSYVREGNLYAIELASRREIALTRDASDTVSFGTAEFIAQEEMDRDTGYWWSPDESRIAYTRVDDSPVPIARRFEINASDVGIVEQRYPYAGGPNAAVTLLVTSLATTAVPVRVDLGPETDIYLARVQFFPDGRTLAVQRQSRDQRRLDLLAADVATGAARTLLTERSDTWVPLHDELRFLEGGRRFIWASDASGRRQLSLHAADGRLVRALTRGDAMVVADGRGAALKAVDERGGWFYYVANAPDTLGRQLFRDRLDAPGSPRQLTQGAGWHSVDMTDDGRHFLDTWSTTEIPPRLALRDRDGKLVEELVANRLAAGHPYFRYAGAHVPAQFGQIDAADGQKLNYLLLKPPGLKPGERAPVIVNVYGGPGVQNVSNAWGGTWQLLNQLLVQRGYVVFMLDNRGSGFRGRQFEAANHLRLGTLEVDDQVRGVEFLRTLPYVDGARIGIYGWSYGGYLSLMCVLKAPQAFAAAVAGAPVTDWRLYDTHYTERYLGKPQDNRSGYDEADVLRFAARLERPLLLMHGMADDNVLFTHTTQLLKVLQDARRPFELMTYPGGKHGLVRRADAGPHALQTLLDFFQRTLPVSGAASSSTAPREH